MASLRMQVPDATTNYVKNPSVRFDTTGYTAVGSTLTRALDRARFGISSLKVVTNGSSLYEGVYYRISWLQGIQTPLNFSVYLRGTGKVRIRLIDNPTGLQEISKTIVLNDNRWTRVSVSGRCTGSNDVRIYVETDKSIQTTTFYADGFQVEPHSYATSYCDGDQDGCTWNIYAHGSISSRTGYTRLGGRWIDLAGCDRQEKNLYLTVIGGMGSAPIRNNIQPYSDAPGSYYQNSKVLDRVINITFHAIAADLRNVFDVSLEKLHSLRQTLFNVIKPDRTRGSEEFAIEYQDGDFPIYGRVRYEAGLEGEWDVRNKFVNSFPIRFLATNPFFSGDTQDAQQLNFRERITVNYVAQRVDGVWSEMNGGMDSTIYEFAVGRRGEVYACGNFTRSNYKTTATDPQIYSNFVAYWDGTQWQKMGSGANGIINSIAIAPNGDVIATGAFTTIGGVSCARIARWSITTQTWSALSTGLANGAGFAVRVAPNGDVYVGGSFTQAGSVTASYCAYYDGSSWHNMGNYLGLNNYVYTLAITLDGTQVYLGGIFTDERTSPGNLVLTRVTLYETVYNQFFELGDGFDDQVYKMVIAPSGRVYACGAFTSSGSEPMLYISYWNGAAWFGLDIGADNTIRNIDVDDFGNVLATGDFTRVGSTDTPYVALFNTATWVNLDVVCQNPCYAGIFGPDGNIFLAMNGTLIDTASINYVTNYGTAETSPKVYILGPATLLWIENQSTHKRLYADLEILQNEEVIIDFTKGRVESTVRGDLAYAINAGSDMRAWTLIPGENKIAALMSNDVNAQMYIYHEPKYWSADSTAYLEDM